MLINKTVIIKWNPKIINHYKEWGYFYTKMGDEFEVKIEDLTLGSHALVDIECDGCNKKIKGVLWKSYRMCVREDKYYCNKCAKNGYKKSNSFEEWCYENLSKKEADKLLSRWDYDLNIDKNGIMLYPRDISHGADVKYWFKCLDHPDHGSELKSIHSCVCGEGSFACNQCNSISTTHPHLAKYLVNKEDALKYSAHTHVKILMKCLNCGYEKNISPDVMLRVGFGCPKCSDGISYPEKFMFNVFEQLLNKDFEAQLSKAILKWCSNYRYDFYISNINCIIETHGIQHYEELTGNWKFKSSLKNIQEIDKHKELLASKNGINNYIIIDCRKSELEWIKNGVINSELPNLLKFKESDVDWLKCHEAGCNSMVKEVCNLWNDGMNNVDKIVNKLKIHRSTVWRYLKKGAKLGWC